MTSSNDKKEVVNTQRLLTRNRRALGLQYQGHEGGGSRVAISESVGAIEGVVQRLRSAIPFCRVDLQC